MYKECNSNEKWNKDKCQGEGKNPIKHRIWKANYVWNPSACASEINYAYTKSLLDDTIVTCDEIIDMVAKFYKNVSDTVSINLDN